MKKSIKLDFEEQKGNGAIKPVADNLYSMPHQIYKIRQQGGNRFEVK